MPGPSVIAEFRCSIWIACLLAVLHGGVLTAAEPATKQPLFRVVDLNVGESQDVELSDGSHVNVTLLKLEEPRDNLRSAIRLARVTVKLNDVVTTIESGNYRLPVTVGDVQIDCSATMGLYVRHDLFEDSWGLDKAARLRLWPKGSPWIEPGSFGYPIKQRWFANVTQAGNEPSYVMGEDAPTSRTIYYHAGNDIGGVEGVDDIIAASDGLVISTAGKTLPDYPDLPFYQQSSYATVYVLDAHGWIYRYTHLKSIDPGVRLGEQIKLGQTVGRLGKEEGAGYYAHLHFDIKSRQPSGKWGVQDAYAFLWQAYQDQYKPDIIAVARPHHTTWVGERVKLDHHRVVEQADAGNLVRHDVFRVTQVGEGGKHGAPLALLEFPVGVGQHIEQRLQLDESRRHEIGHVGAAHALQRVGGRGEDLLVVGDADRLASSLEFASEVTQVSIREFDRQFERHSVPRLREATGPGAERSNSTGVGCADALKCGTRRKYRRWR
jgi:murein DD-endopeptidase MepM/ murein hydrolase activator NlpD